MNVAIIQYNAGNTMSVVNALERLNVKAIVTDDASIIRSADKVIFPGVGEARSAMTFLNKSGLAETIRQLAQPFLGICLGMQLLCRHTEESDVECIGIFDLQVKKFTNGKVPHMGWNKLAGTKGKLFANASPESHLYFVHSYYVPESPFTSAFTKYGSSFSAAIQNDNFFGVQFHPEKSGNEGENILRNFINL